MNDFAGGDDYGDNYDNENNDVGVDYDDVVPRLSGCSPIWLVERSPILRMQTKLLATIEVRLH